MFSKYPFVRYLIALVAGIALEYYFYIPLPILLLLAALNIGCLCFCKFFLKKYSNVQKTLFGSIALLLIFLLGTLSTHFNNQLNNQIHISHQNSNVKFYSGIITSEIQTTPKYYKFYIQVYKIYHNKWASATGKVLVYLPKFSNYIPTYGDKLIVKGNPKEFMVKRNPFDFDYKRFLANQLVYHQHYLKENEIKLIETGCGNLFFATSIQSRNYLNAILCRNIKDTTSSSIASALVLGVRGNLDAEIKNAYSSTGTMHVLAVSGMHVAIIYYILVMIFGWIRLQKNGLLIYYLLIISSLWGYAFVTGLSPSVLRAVTMFSIIVTADVLRKQANIWNSIALSAFILLIVNPYLLFDAGFQLSYLAVVGIIYFQPLFYNLFVFKNYFVDELWKILTASMAAQFAVCPLCILYFNQFPNLFLVSNLFIVPLSTIILYFSLAGLLLFHIPIIGLYLGYLIEFLVYMMNSIALFIEKIPFSVYHGLSLTAFETILIYLIMFQIVLFVKFRKIRFATYFTLLLAIWSINLCINLTINSKRNILNIYSVPNTQQVELYQGLKGLVITNNLSKELNNKLLAYRNLINVAHTYHLNHLRNVKLNYVVYKNGAILMVKNGIKILIINGNFNQTLIKQAQVIIFGGNSFEKLGIDNTLFRDKIVILDSSNDKNLSKRYFYQCLRKGVVVYNVHIHNALVLDLNKKLDALRKI